MRKSADVVVIGAGVVGTALAWNLQRQGLSVILVDRARPGRGSSAASFAWANASSKIRRRYGEEYFALNQQGLMAAYRLADRLGTQRWFHPVGAIEVATSDADRQALRSDVRTMLDRGYEAYIVDPDDVRHFEPALRTDADAIFGYYPAEAWVDGPALVDALLADASSSGALQVVLGEPAEFSGSGERLANVRLRSGTQLSAETFAITAGAWTPDVAALAGVEVPLVPRDHHSAHGIIATVPQSSTPLTTTVLSEHVLLRPHREGQLLLAGDGHGVDVSESSATSRQAAATELLRRAQHLVPSLVDSTVMETAVGIRPLPTDGESVVGFAAPHRNLYVAVTHSGVTLAALLGELCAQELVHRRPVPQLDAFRPTRFAGAASPVGTDSRLTDDVEAGR